MNRALGIDQTPLPLPPYEAGTYAQRNTGEACWSCSGLMTHAPAEECIYPDAHGVQVVRTPVQNKWPAHDFRNCTATDHDVTARHPYADCRANPNRGEPQPKFSVEVHIELHASDEDAAYERVADIMEAAWDRVHRPDGPLVKVEAPWHYEMFQGCVSEADDS